MFKVYYTVSLLAYYLKGVIAYDGNFLSFQMPNTILKLIPLGKTNKTIAVDKIASVDDSFSLNFKTLLLGAVAGIVGLGMLESGDNIFAGLLITAYGIGTIISSFEVILEVSDTSGGGFVVNFLVFEKNKVEEVKTFILEEVSRRIDDTNVRVHQERSTDRIVDAINHKK